MPLITTARPSGGADFAAERYAGCLGPFAPGRLFRLGAGGPLGRGAVRRSGGSQSVPALCFVAGLPTPDEVVPYLRPRSVLAGQRSASLSRIGCLSLAPFGFLRYRAALRGIPHYRRLRPHSGRPCERLRPPTTAGRPAGVRSRNVTSERSAGMATVQEAKMIMRRDRLPRATRSLIIFAMIRPLTCCNSCSPERI